MERLYVLYDPACGFCVQCARWLSWQKTFVPLACIASGSPRALRKFPKLRGTKEELTVVDDRGGVYRGSKAWLMTLWALEEYRPWASRLASPRLLPFARNAFELVASHRHALSKIFRLRSETEIAKTLSRAVETPRCADGACVPRKCADCSAAVSEDAIWCAACGRHAGPVTPAIRG